LLTKRQQEIWEFLVEYVDAHGYPPTVREIGEEVGLASPSTVHAHLANLERAGLIKRDPTKPRALELTGRETRRASRDDSESVHALPLLGQIAAGGPLLAEQNVDAYIQVPEPLSKGGDEEFLLKVRGDSMQDAGILEGDFVVVRRQQDARNGDIVVALAGDDESADEATVKRFFRESGRVRLQPENQAYEPIYSPHVQVLGKVIGVFCERRRSSPHAGSGGDRRSSRRLAGVSCVRRVPAPPIRRDRLSDLRTRDPGRGGGGRAAHGFARAVEKNCPRTFPSEFPLTCVPPVG
jgi:repressor LexA